MSKRKLSEKDIMHLAKLANLNLSEVEIKKFSEQLSSVLDYVDQLNEVDIKNVESFSTLGIHKNKSREDQVLNKNKISSLNHLKTTDKGGKNYFKVQRIME